MSVVLLTMILHCAICGSFGARILGIFPTPSYSHQQPYQTIMTALAGRGHEVTVISPNPLKTKTRNYVDVDVSFSYKFWRENTPGNNFYYTTRLDMYWWLTRIGNGLCELQLESDEIQDFMRDSNKSFDLVVMETFVYQCYYGLVHHIGSPPVVGVVSTLPQLLNYISVGNPLNPAYYPSPMSPYTNDLSFLQRLDNFLYFLLESAILRPLHLYTQDKIIRKYFNASTPTAEEMDGNIAAILVNSYWACDYPIARVPGMIEIGGVHVSNITKTLPKDLKEFADGAVDGFIYISLGSNVRSDKMPEKQKEAMFEIFSQLPYKILWKWESSNKTKHENLKLVKWVPQQDVLAHPNLKVFVTQGGLQSVNEATYHGVPMLIIPVYGDQEHNAVKIVSAGAGIMLKVEDLDTNSLCSALRTLLNNVSYAENAKRFSAICYDRQVHPLDRAIWWIEYVLRHNGAPFIRSSVLNLSWYQYWLIDVCLFLITVFSSVLITIMIIIRQFYKGCAQNIKTKKL